MTSLRLDRREFLAASSAAAIAVVTGSASGQSSLSGALQPLPYPQNALAPSISENTISFHYGKHHQTYFNNLIKLIPGTEFEKSSLEEIIKKTFGRTDQSAFFNNAAQVYNHDFYWKSMKPGGGGEPKGKILEKIVSSFGSYQKFAETFSSAAATQFGSGWAWLVDDGAKLQVVKTPNAEVPITTGAKPMIAIDVWEHAYYLDYQNRRTDYIKAFVEKLLNWDFAEQNLV